MSTVRANEEHQNSQKNATLSGVFLVTPCIRPTLWTTW